MFTVILDTRVIRVHARSVQHLQRCLKAVGMRWQAIHEDKDKD